MAARQDGSRGLGVLFRCRCSLFCGAFLETRKPQPSWGLGPGVLQGGPRRRGRDPPDPGEAKRRHVSVVWMCGRTRGTGGPYLSRKSPTCQHRGRESVSQCGLGTQLPPPPTPCGPSQTSQIPGAPPGPLLCPACHQEAGLCHHGQQGPPPRRRSTVSILAVHTCSRWAPRPRGPSPEFCSPS